MHDYSIILHAATDADGVAPFSEAFEQALSDATLNHSLLTIPSTDVPGGLAGLASIAPDGSAELVVHPEVRRRGIGAELARRVLEQRPDAGLWAHGNLPGARALAESLGLEPTRELLVMACEGDDLRDAAQLTLPDGYQARTLASANTAGEQDAVEREWLRVNNEAFSWHPEQGGWDLERLHRAMRVEWFDPEGVWFLSCGDELAGFSWTKVHPDGTGEVYVVGLANDYRGRGLGAPLMQLALSHLVGEGKDRVILYVEADNAPAVARYEGLGFAVAERHVVYGGASESA